MGAGSHITARHDGMPRAAIAMGVVDVVLPAKDLGQELNRIVRHPFIATLKAPGDDLGLADEQLNSIFLLLRRASGVDFTHYKYPTIKRRLQRRMLLHRLNNLDEYLKYLHQNPTEINSLYQDLLIHVTRFFREPEAFKMLDAQVFPKILEGRGHDNPIRIWVPGCATGEEPYSIAMTLREHLGEQGESIPIQIFATDVSETAIEHARLGIYPESISADVSPERLRRFFTKTDGGYRVSKRIRGSCIFARQDITRDPPFSMLDLIACRNVLIYLGPILQKKLINLFHYALKPVGFLLLGAAETVGPYEDLFAPLDRHFKLYSKRVSGVRTDMDFSRMREGRDRPEMLRKVESRMATNIDDEVNRVILNRYSPAGVVVTSDMQILHFRGQTGPFLEPSPGEASLNLLKMVRVGLLHGLRSAFSEARRTGKPAHADGLHIQIGGTSRDVDLHVVPLAKDNGYFLVLFEDAAVAQDAAPNRKSSLLKAAENRRPIPRRWNGCNMNWPQAVITCRPLSRILKPPTRNCNPPMRKFFPAMKNCRAPMKSWIPPRKNCNRPTRNSTP